MSIANFATGRKSVKLFAKISPKTLASNWLKENWLMSKGFT